MKLFSVYDVKAGLCLRVISEKTSIQALRNFEIAVNEEDTVLRKFPDDFCLMELGELDVSSGVIVPAKSPINLGSARTVLCSPEKVTPIEAHLQRSGSANV